MTVNPTRIRERLQEFQFKDLFIAELGWSNPASGQTVSFTCKGVPLTRRQIAQLGGVAVFEIVADDGTIPDKTVCQAVYREIERQYHEHLLIFLDRDQTQSLWYWMKRDGTNLQPRPHLYIKGQPGDLFVSKIVAMFVDIGELDAEGNVSVVEMAERLRRALDVQPTTKKFYEAYQREHVEFIKHIGGIGDERDRQWYASVLLNRLMFIYFLQRKGWLDKNRQFYLQDKLAACKRRGTNRYYTETLRPLFFEAFALPVAERTAEVRAALGAIPYLSGSIFLMHPIEERWPEIAIDDAAFESLFALFQSFSWNLDDTPGADDNEINPDVLGYIFEKYINQKAFGAYYTRTEITEYLCAQTIHRVILDKINVPGVPGVAARHFDSMDDLLIRLDAPLCRTLLFDILPNLSILDPACGSGAFLVAAMKTLIRIYSKVVGTSQFVNDRRLNSWYAEMLDKHPSPHYFIKKEIISHNLFGVDIMEEAAEIAQLRLYLALVSSVSDETQLEPLPNIDFNLLTGNSLIGLLKVDEAKYPATLFYSYKDVVRQKNDLIAAYRDVASPDTDLRKLRDDIQAHRNEAAKNLDDLLLDDWNRLGIKYVQATWDASKQKEGNPVKRALTVADIARLRPFHWGYEFDQVLNERGGFDAIITNPPWEVFQTDEKEFFHQYDNLIQKNKLTIKEWETQRGTLMQDTEIRDAWLEYASSYPHSSAFFRKSSQYAACVSGKINLYTVFTEQCYNLLRPGGQCGIVIPSGIYTDLGTKQLRELLFSETEISGLFCFENRRMIFEGVESRFKFIVLTYGKGGSTATFPAAFMRHEVAELERFPQEGALDLSVALIRRLSPDSLSVMEFKNETDVQIAEKMLRFPLLGEKIEGTWNLVLTNEFHMTNDSHLFQTAPGPGRLPLYEGKMIHQFTHQWGEPRYWVDTKQGRAAVLGRRLDTSQHLGYQAYRLGFRDIAASTNERTMIASVLPANVFAGNTINLSSVLGYGDLLVIVAFLNSFAVDSVIRKKVTSHCNMFYVYQLPIPRLTERDAAFTPIVERAARLICTTPEFDDLARSVGLRGHEDGVTDDAERARLRAELDGMVAHLYGLTDDEFAHILATFPLVPQATKDAALDAYRALAPQPGDPVIAALIAGGESKTVEFKESVRWDTTGQKRGEKVIVKSVAAFLNGEGGTLLIGVRDDGTPVGLAADYATLREGKRNRDGFELFLAQLLRNELGNDKGMFYDVTFPVAGGSEICRITVRPAIQETWVREDGSDRFYVRSGNASIPLAGRELTQYTRNRWP